jgi:hypothetical protein
LSFRPAALISVNQPVVVALISGATQEAGETISTSAVEPGAPPGRGGAALRRPPAIELSLQWQSRESGTIWGRY